MADLVVGSITFNPDLAYERRVGVTPYFNPDLAYRRGGIVPPVIPPLKPKKEEPMAELKLNIGTLIRKEMITALADMIPKEYRLAVVLRILLLDETTRMMIAEAIGEEGIRQHHLDISNQDMVDRGMPEGSYRETSWDEIAISQIVDLMDTPGGRGEVV